MHLSKPPPYLKQLPRRLDLQDEVVAYVRRRSSAFSRGKSRYRGVSGHTGRWEARIGSFNGRKNVRLLLLLDPASARHISGCHVSAADDTAGWQQGTRLFLQLPHPACLLLPALLCPTAALPAGVLWCV